MQALDILSRAWESDLEVTCVRAEQGRLQAMAEHLIPHSPESATTLLDPVKVGKALSQDGVARTRTILAFSQCDQRNWFRRKTGARNNDPIGEDLEDDLATSILILPMRHCVD